MQGVRGKRRASDGEAVGRGTEEMEEGKGLREDLRVVVRLVGNGSSAVGCVRVRVFANVCM